MVSAPTHSTDMLIRKLGGIARLSNEERKAIECLPISGRPLAAGHDIVQEKDRPSHSCLILHGWACRYQMISNGRRQILSFHIPGDIPDLPSLHLRVMDYNICTLTNATVALIPHEALLELTAAFPDIAAILWRDTLLDGAIFRRWMTAMGRRSALEATAHLLCELYVKLEAVGFAQDHECRLPLTQQDLGDALGLSSVHVNRTLRDMREMKLAILHGGILKIHKWQELVDLCDFDPAYLHLDRGANEFSP